MFKMGHLGPMKLECGVTHVPMKKLVFFLEDALTFDLGAKTPDLEEGVTI